MLIFAALRNHHRPAGLLTCSAPLPRFTTLITRYLLGGCQQPPNRHFREGRGASFTNGRVRTPLFNRELRSGTVGGTAECECARQSAFPFATSLPHRFPGDNQSVRGAPAIRAIGNWNKSQNFRVE